MEEKDKMKADTQNKIDYYVELYDTISNKTGNDAITVVIFQEVIKDMRMKYIAKTNGNGNGNADALATEKQKEYLRKMGRAFDEGLTKKDASAMIDEEIKK